MNYKKKRYNGFTLLEMVIALGLFSLVITTAIGLFVRGSSSQKKALELFAVQREANYLLETISRDLRMAIEINNDQAGNNDSSIEFTDHGGSFTEYCLSDINGVCDDVNGKYLAKNNIRISSGKVSIENLKFYTSYFDSIINPTQRLLTIVLEVKALNQNTNIVLQTSISMRIYNN